MTIWYLYISITSYKINTEKYTSLVRPWYSQGCTNALYFEDVMVYRRHHHTDLFLLQKTQAKWFAEKFSLKFLLWTDYHTVVLTVVFLRPFLVSRETIRTSSDHIVQRRSNQCTFYRGRLSLLLDTNETITMILNTYFKVVVQVELSFHKSIKESVAIVFWLLTLRLGSDSYLLSNTNILGYRKAICNSGFKLKTYNMLMLFYNPATKRILLVSAKRFILLEHQIWWSSFSLVGHLQYLCLLHPIRPAHFLPLPCQLPSRLCWKLDRSHR